MPNESSSELRDFALFINRELSQLEFNRRVLAQAEDERVPLLERLRFLTISCSNLDEFFEIRCAGLKQQQALGVDQPGPDGLNNDQTLAAISSKAHELVGEQYRVLNQVLLPALAGENIRLSHWRAWTPEQETWIRGYFEREVQPVLTPIGLDPAHPFPRVLNKSLNLLVALEGRDAFGRGSGVAVVQVPRSLPRIVAFPEDVGGGAHNYVLLSWIVTACAAELFPGMKLTGCYPFRVTRNSDLWVDHEEVDDLLHALEGELPRRNWGDAVRLEVTQECPAEIAAFLLTQFSLQREDLYQVDGPVNLHRLTALYTQTNRPDLKYRALLPSVPRALAHGRSIFDALREQDVLLHHPFQSFAPVIEFVRQAAADPNVLAIKQTLYRTGGDSPVVDALIEAASAGKEVTVVVELRARFDEAQNIDLATRLQEAGANVLYGVVGYKTHAKMLMVVRREKGRLRRYVHVGTGNYHTGTARGYTDFSLLSSNKYLCEDVHDLFLQLTGLGSQTTLQKLVQAPFTLNRTILELIEGEATEARAGRPSRIVAKMNSLCDPAIIRALYRASQAGVSIDLIVRGICSLRPGMSGVSENIRVRSIVGRFLEHSRVYCFHAAGREQVYISSADWMQRNLFRRVEIAIPIEDELLRNRVVAEGLSINLADDQQSWILNSDGQYRRAGSNGGEALNAQERLLQQLSDSGHQQLEPEPTQGKRLVLEVGPRQRVRLKPRKRKA